MNGIDRTLGRSARDDVVVVLEKVGASGSSNVQIRGISDNVLAFRPEVKIVAGRPAQPGTDEVIVGQAIRGRMKGLELGQTFELRKNRPLKVVGAFADSGSSFESEVWADLSTIRGAFGREGLVSSVRVRLQEASKLDAFKASLAQNPRLALEAIRESDYYEKLSSGTSVLFKTMGILVVALLGGAVGALASLAMGIVRFSTVNIASWAEIVFTFEPTLGIVTGSMILAAVMGLLGGFFPALKAARMNPIEAMRG